MTAQSLEPHKEEIRRFYKSGKSGSEIAQIFNVAATTVYELLKRLKIKKEQKKEKYYNKVIKDYKRGLFSTEISQKYNISTSLVLDILNKNNIQIRKPVSKLEKYKKEIFNLWKSGFILGKIAKKFKVSDQCILNFLTKYGKDKKISKIERNKKRIIKFYNKGWSSGKISKRFGFSESTILRNLRKWEIKVRTGQRNHKYKINHNIFNQIKTEHQAYWLGFLCADGCNLEKNGKITLEIAKRDISHLYKFRRFLESSHRIEKFIKKKSKINGIEINSGEHVSIRPSSKQISQDLAKLGCWTRKTLNLEFPNFNQVPKKLIKFFIRGYFDGDGGISIHYRKDINYIEIACSFSSTKKFLEELQKFLLENLNLNSCLVKAESKMENHYNLSVGGNRKAIYLLDYLYFNSKISLNRKYKKFLKIIEIFKKRTVKLQDKEKFINKLPNSNITNSEFINLLNKYA